jgi:hypothetical protein
MGLVTACSPANQTSAQLEAVNQISTAASTAREGVLLVRKYVSDEDSWEYTEARALYINAQVAFDGWIDQLKTDIEFGTEPNAENYDAMLADGIQKTTDFLKHVQQIEQANVSGGTGNSGNEETSTATRDDVSTTLLFTITSIIVNDIIIEGGIEFWKASQDMKQREQDRNLRYLDTLKWESFDKIK